MTFSPQWAELLGRLARLSGSHCSGLRIDLEDGVFNSLSLSQAAVLGDREMGPEAHLSSCGLPLGASRVSPILLPKGRPWQLVDGRGWWGGAHVASWPWASFCLRQKSIVVFPDVNST